MTRASPSVVGARGSFSFVASPAASRSGAPHPEARSAGRWARASGSACNASVIASASLTRPARQRARRRLVPAGGSGVGLQLAAQPSNRCAAGPDEPQDAVELPGRLRRAAGGPSGGQLRRTAAGGGGAAGPGGAGRDAGAGAGLARCSLVPPSCGPKAVPRAHPGGMSSGVLAAPSTAACSHSAARIRGSAGGWPRRPSTASIARYSGHRFSSSTNRHTRRSAASRSSRQTARSSICPRSAVRRRGRQPPSRSGATCSARSSIQSKPPQSPGIEGGDSPCTPCSIRSPMTPRK
jgi:hypothetical protein